MNFFTLWLVTLPVLAVIDLVWILGVARTFYRSQLGTLLSAHPNWMAAIAFYVLYTAGLAVFVLMPAVASRSLLRAIVAGAFFGLVAYGTYDLTNLATTTGWPLTMSIVDMVWGTIAGGLVSGGVYLLAIDVLGV